MKLTKAPAARSDKITPADDRPEIGQWFWVRGHGEPGQYDKAGKWLGCVVEVGSNYAKLRGVRHVLRVSIDDLVEKLEPEPDPGTFIRQKLDYHKGQVRELLGEVKRICAQLGIPMNQSLAAETEAASTALAVAHGVDDVRAHKRALVKAKEKTLPELFAKVKDQHEAMSVWMKADLIPAHAELARAEGVTEQIEGKIHTVELYAGLQEKLEQVRDGEAAPAATRITVLQARKYMDEECLARYEAGGMDFKDIRAFDKWLSRDENLFRLLPHPRCVVAFRIRRHDKRYGDDEDTLANHIKFWQYNEANKHTFLYIRNGHQLWRMETSTEFGEELFPRAEDHELLSNEELWIKESAYDIEHDHGIITARQRAGYIEDWRAARAYVAQALRQWHRAGKPETEWTYVAIDHPSEQYRWKAGEPHETEGDPRELGGLCADEHSRAHHPQWREYVRLTPESIYYDDVMKRTQRAALDQNRVAVVLQGLLDRSTCLHPHPPWRIWTPEGFAAGVELVWDASLTITAGEKPDWTGYLRQLARSLKTGSTTIGQQAAWVDWATEHYGSDRHRLGYYHPSGAGPKFADRVVKLWRDGSATFAFKRNRSRAKWVPSERKGYIKRAYPDIEMSWRTPKDLVLFCVDAYTPGDFHIFFDDPRTRCEYLKWAPYLLTAEDWHARRRAGHAEPEDD